MNIIEKITPTPWKVIGLRHIHVADESIVAPIAICEDVTARMKSGECYANAAHIVKCVNLHDELVDAVEYYCSVMREAWGNEAFEKSNDHVISKMRNALAKAKAGAA